MSTQVPIGTGAGNVPGPNPPSVVLPIAPPGTSMVAAAPVLPSRRMGAELDAHWRVLAAVVGALALTYGALLAWREESDGIAVAAAFAVGLVTLIFALAGVVPASVKVGDVEVQLQQAKDAGKEEGKEEGKKEGTVTGLQTAAAVCQKMKEGALEPDEVEARLNEALSSDQPLDFPTVPGPALPVTNLGDEAAAAAASAMAQAFSPS